MKKMRSPEIQLLELESVDSTNIYAKDNFDALSDGTLVCAETQTAGRGRLGRQWISPPGVNIYASLVMKRIDNPFYATIVASLAVLEMLQNELPRTRFFIKWPNDIYTGCRKICGILCECSTAASAVNGVIAGIGVNINLEKSDLEKIGQPAASLKSLSGRVFDVRQLTTRLADALGRYYAVYLHEPDRLFAEWKEYNFVIGRKVSLADSAGTVRTLLIRDIAETGELVAEENGSPCRFHCGDVILRKETLFGSV